MADLTNPRAKLARAEEHLKDLVDEAKVFADTDPFSVLTEERARDLDVVRVQIREAPPLRLGLIFGDVLANWRSALDNLANQLVLLNGNDPGRSTSFPIFSSGEDFARRGIKRIKGVSQAHSEIIEELQPFQDGDSPANMALAVVNEYAVIDKHRAIHPVFSAVVDAEGYARSFRRDDLASEFFFEVIPVGFSKRLEDGMELAHIRWQQPVPQPKPAMGAEFPARLGFGERGLALDALPEIGHHLKTVVERFAPDFSM